MAIPVPVCDPHFHVWDMAVTENENLGGIRDAYPVYSMATYAADAARLDLRSAVHVETVVGQVLGAWGGWGGGRGMRG